MSPGRSLRFAMVTTFFPPYHVGGDAVYVHRLSNELAQRGHAVDVVHCRDAYDLVGDGAPNPAGPLHPGVTVHTLESRAGVLSPLLTQQTGRPALKAPALHRLLDGDRFDVIHFHNVSLVGGPGVLAYGDAVKLYTVHEYWLVCPTHILFKDNRHACREPECLRCTLHYRRPPQLWRSTGLVEEAVRHVDAFLAPSRFTAEMHAARGLDLPTVLLPLFAPHPPPVDVAEHANGGRPYVLFVGRLEKLKGLQDVLPAFAGVDGPDLLVVGDGGYRAELERRAAASPRVRFLGRQPFEALGPLYAGALALAVPSLCYETFGQVVLEAFSMRTPVVARRIGALAELVEESGGGRLFETADEFVRIVQALGADPALRERLAENGHAHFRAHGTAEHHLSRYLTLVDDLLARRASRARGGVEERRPGDLNLPGLSS